MIPDLGELGKQQKHRVPGGKTGEPQPCLAEPDFGLYALFLQVAMCNPFPEYP